MKIIIIFNICKFLKRKQSVVCSGISIQLKKFEIKIKIKCLPVTIIACGNYFAIHKKDCSNSGKQEVHLASVSR